MGVKKKWRVLLDIVMTILFLAVMAYHITDNWLHEWLGAVLLGLFFADYTGIMVLFAAIAYYGKKEIQRIGALSLNETSWGRLI